MSPAPSSEAAVAVWDPLVRILHWVLAASVVLGWITTAVLVGWHQAAGWTALVAVGVRIAWGGIGPGAARFSHFVRGPRRTARYAGLVLRGREPRYLGHNPLGAWMALALMACVVVLALSGWLYTTDWLWGDATVEAVHRAFAWLIVGLAVVHVIGVAFTSARHRENLVVAMINGMKRAPREDEVA